MKRNPARIALQRRNQSLQERSTDNYRRLLIRVCQTHRTDYMLRAELLLKKLDKQSVLALVDLADSLVLQKYSTPWEHFMACQFSYLIRKYPFPKGLNPFKPEETAFKKFEASEAKCHRINQRFKARRLRTKSLHPYETALAKMRSFIAYAIGVSPNLGRVFRNVGFGPGASIGCNGNATNVARKLRARWSVSPGAYHYAYSAVMNHAQVREMIFPNPGGFTDSGLSYDPFKGPFAEKAQLVAYNKISFVPKTAKTFRSIAVEPLLNGFVQKGIDLVLRDNLRRIGIDLSDQEPNAELARLGSLGGEDPFCTIDLSSASDSISIEVVREVLPPDWFAFLDATRSKNYSYKGRVKRFSKFCSMGNGFCFPLETLIFTAACHAVGAGRPGIDFRVYGDDIVVRRSKFDEVVRLLSYLGFSVNSEKTFSEGPFRESCGRDWFAGVDVRPYTLDFALDSVQSLFKFLNGTLRNSFTEEFFSGVRQFLLSLIPEDYRFFRPHPGPEDTAITSRCDEFLSSPHVLYRSYGNGNGCWSWKELISLSVSDRQIEYWARRDGACALVYAALCGSASAQPFSIRRETRTKVRVITHPGASSNWLPPPMSFRS